MISVDVFVPHEPLLLGMAEIFQKRVEIAGDIQQPHGFVVETELIPGHGLEEFLQGAETAGQRDVGARQRGESFLALVDRIDMLEADAVVPNEIREIRRNDPRSPRPRPRRRRPPRPP